MKAGETSHAHPLWGRVLARRSCVGGSAGAGAPGHGLGDGTISGFADSIIVLNQMQFRSDLPNCGRAIFWKVGLFRTIVSRQRTSGITSVHGGICSDSRFHCCWNRDLDHEIGFPCSLESRAAENPESRFEKCRHRCMEHCHALPGIGPIGIQESIFRRIRETSNRLEELATWTDLNPVL